VDRFVFQETGLMTGNEYRRGGRKIAGAFGLALVSRDGVADSGKHTIRRFQLSNARALLHKLEHERMIARIAVLWRCIDTPAGVD